MIRPAPSLRALRLLDAALARLRGAGDALLALAVLAVVFLLVAPLPAPLLDALLALNLAASATVVVVTLLARDALRLAAFPAVLLLTTLFRLALNVASTRLVLTRGEAGRVIEAFGRVVVRGDAVTGAVVFAILTLVQLLVVAKGAERVAEVAARFTLDALPGKQLAIDADARAGTVDAAEARRRRRALERESQLYGAMDGALKFVKGDAIAGVAIVLVNLLGGAAAGVVRGQGAEAALRRFALLAIGDGLVSQLPALLLAVSAGLAVTRVASEEEGGTLGGELARQVAAEPRALAAVAALLVAVGLAPGLPAAPFLALAAAAALSARHLLRGGGRAAGPGARAGEEAGAGDSAAGEAAEGWLTAAPVALRLGASLYPAAPGAERLLRDGLAGLRERIRAELGVEVPPVAVEAGGEGDGWLLLVDDVPVASGRAPAGEALALAPPDELALAGLSGTAAADPLTGRPATIVAAADAPRASALAPVRDPLGRAVADAGLSLGRAAHLLVGVQEAQALLEALEAAAPALVREASRQLPPPVLAEVLRRLVEEGVSIRPLRTILEALLEAGGAPRGAPALAEAARRALRRHIGHRLAGDGPLAALLLDPGAEGAVRGALAGDGLALDPEVAARLLDALGRALDAAGGARVLLASGDVRRALRGLVAPRFPGVAVVAYEDLPPELPVRPMGRLALAA